MECNPEKIKSHLHRIEGQIRAIEKMYDEKREIEELIRLVFAVRASLDSVSKMLITDKLNGCYDHKTLVKKEELAKLIDTLFQTT